MDKLKLAALGERLKVGGERLRLGGAQMSRSISDKMKEILQGPTQEAKLVDEATAENMEEANWGLNLRICALLNSEELSGPEIVRAIKKKIAGKSPVSQRLSLDLLETCAMNCDKVFSEIASEKVLDDMVRMIDNPQTYYSNRQRALQLIKAWGESEDLAYLPVFRQTYMSLKGRGMPFSIPDDGNSATSTLESVMYEEAIPLPDEYPRTNMDEHNTDQHILSYHGAMLSAEEKREILVVTRNSIEILSSLLNSENGQKPVKNLQDDLTQSMIHKCKESQPIIQRIIETTTDDEGMLFEALNLHEELQNILSKYNESENAAAPPVSDQGNRETPVVSDVPAESTGQATTTEKEGEKVVSSTGGSKDGNSSGSKGD